MMDQEQFQEILQNLLEKDRARPFVEASGASVEEALGQAAIELGIPVRRLEYEILERGKRNFLGISKKEWRLKAYEAQGSISSTTDESLVSEDVEGGEDQDVEQVKNGDFAVRLASSGAYLKVTAPGPGGVKVKREDIIHKLKSRAVEKLDMERIDAILAAQEGEYVKVGEFQYSPINDAWMTVEVSPDEMEATMEVQEPGLGGADMTAAGIVEYLKSSGVVFGILEDVLSQFEDHPVYGTPWVIARGDPPVNGRNASVNYLFEHGPSQIKLKHNPDGSVNFKELNLIQNVVEGQPLARKIPPEPGHDGRTVSGKYIPAKDGTDIQMELGKNVSIADNGRTVIAAASGQVLLLKGKVTVEKVMVIPGDVNAATGNVNGLGTVIVKGNVEDGFSVSAQANIEVNGFVGKANLQAGADIVVKKGINGGETEFGKITAGKSLWASFINNSHVDVLENVIVSDGIVNARIKASGRILCKGKRARIVGGELQAAEEINAVTLGSSSGSETILRVGFDPRARTEKEELLKQQKALDEELMELERNLNSLLKHKRRQSKLSAEKESLFRELKKRHDDLVDEVETNIKAVKAIEEHLVSVQKQGRISASRNVNTGVKVFICDDEYEVAIPYDYPVTFLLEEGKVSTAKYEDIPEEDLQRRE